MNVEVFMYPSGGGETGYVFSVNDDKFVVETKELGIDNESIVLKKTIGSDSKSLSPEQQKIVQGYISQLQQLNVKYEDAELTLDTWVFNIKLDGKSIVVVNSFLLSKSSTPSGLKEFIKYLISLSPSKVELKGFS